MGDHFGQIILIRPDQIIWGNKLFRDTGTSTTSITENFTTTTSSRPTSTRTTLTAAATTPPPIKAMSLQPKPTLPASILRMKPGYETCDSCHTCSEYCEMKSKRVWIVVVL